MMVLTVENIPDFAVEKFRFWKIPVISKFNLLPPLLFNLYFHRGNFFIGVFDMFVIE